MTRLGRFSWFAVALVPTIAYVLHDFVFQLPDNQGDITPGFVFTVSGLLMVWGSAGYLVARRSRGWMGSIASGAMAAAISVGVLWLAFIVLNGLFLDRMSYEPNRLLAFRRSGYATMREYWNHQAGWGPFPLVLAVAAVLGAAGAFLQRTVRRARNLLPMRASVD